MRERFHSPVDVEECSVEMAACVKQRIERFDEQWVGGDGVARHIVEAGVIDLRGQHSSVRHYHKLINAAMRPPRFAA